MELTIEEKMQCVFGLGKEEVKYLLEEVIQSNKVREIPHLLI